MTDSSDIPEQKSPEDPKPALSTDTYWTALKAMGAIQVHHPESTPEPTPARKQRESTTEYLRKAKARGCRVNQRTSGGVEMTGDWVRGIKHTKNDPPPQP